jgi:cyclic beta-1,2-glucan synthetase
VNSADQRSESGSRESAPGLCPGCDPSRRWDEPPVLRGEILSPERLVEHAVEIARAHGDPGRSGAPRLLWQRFVNARSSLREAYDILKRDAAEQRDPSPAEEWLLDNSHVVEEQFREIEEDLPRGYLRELPRLSDGAMRGCPSVYGLCIDYLRHTDARVDLDILCRYVQSYQAVRQLTIGELWAVPIMLRLGLLLTVSAIAAAETSSRDRPRGDDWADKLLAGGKNPSELPLRLLEIERGTPITAAFLVQLTRRLREHDEPALGVVFDWIAVQSAKLGAAPEELVRRQLLHQAADQVSVGNAVTSMRAIAAFDWHEFFERTSAVEALLGKDPAGAYALTDPNSRDRYRHAVEALARRGRSNELGVAQAALELAKQHAPEHSDRAAAQAHVGYYLLDDGRRELERRLGYRPRLGERIRRAVTSHPSSFYFGAIGLMTAALCAAAAAYLGAPSVGLVAVALIVLLVMPAMELAIEFVNALVVSGLRPRLLSRFAFDDGIPPEHRTLVAVPALLESRQVIDRLLEDIEVRSLANSDPNLHFALLTDFIDADSPELASDGELLQHVEQGIRALNERHGDGQRYWLFHRRRLENRREGRFMGWDRKRGKLEELNRLLRGAADTSFSVVLANQEWFPSIRYVITLDADTELPRDSARKLVATLAHPLNRPVVDPVKRRVVRGYGIAQPRVGTLPQSSRESRFAAIAAGPPGIDPYTTAVSDVYQDLFGEGSYVGKGIYDVDAFAAVLKDRVPENLLLSHDLFEGLYARSALVTDVEVLDEQPSAYEVQAGRQHRWIRGDWQLVQWLLPRVPTRASGSRPSDLRFIDWWKLFDNLRRSLLGPILIAIVLIGWFADYRASVVATAALAAVLFAPLVLRLVFQLARDPRRLSPSLFGALGGDLRTNAIQAFLSLAVLLDQALVSIDAIARTAYRLIWSKRRLMEWRTMRQSARQFAAGGAPVAARTWFSAGLALLLGFSLFLLEPEALWFALPVLLCWVCAPFVVGWLSQRRPAPKATEKLSDADRRLLRMLGAKTWRYFETFVTERDNYLPPDNYQEDPRGVVAHRTSPTNIGLYLLSAVAARDLGHITLRDLAERLGRTLGTLERMERRSGHILNWYDTESLRPLDPQYVSTVDSGNLVAALWTLRQACDEFCETPVIGPQALEAAADVIAIASSWLEQGPARSNEVARELSVLEQRLRAAAPGLALGSGRALELLAELAEVVAAASRTDTLRGAPGVVRVELARAESLLRVWYESLRELWPFARLLHEAPKVLAEGSLGPGFRALESSLSSAQSPAAIRDAAASARNTADAWITEAGLSPADRAGVAAYLGELVGLCRRAEAACLALESVLRELGARAAALGDGMDFRFLFDEARELFVTGYNVSSVRLDTSHYDLLASEARVASLIAVAKDDVPQDHWFRLGRPRTAVGSRRCLLSWSGSMFEFLMPLLVTKNHADTLLHETCESAVIRQTRYAAERGVPWGISESSYNVMDFGMTYQYRAFGVPGLGLKAGLGEDLVIAPYATALAAMVRPELAVKNLRVLSREGVEGPYGHYEAIDYTPAHVPPGRKAVVVKSFMAHHQGMTLVSIDNVLNDFTMPARFHRDPRIKASELLLEERVPARAPLTKLAAAAIATAPHGAPELDLTEHVALDSETGPRLHLLGHGELSTLVSSTGNGVTTWKGIDINRFREDPVLDAGGIYVYIRNLSSPQTWSAAYQPTCARADFYDASFAIDRVELHRRDGEIETVTEILPSPEHPAEVRRITLTNHGSRPLDVDLTTYTEIVLAPRGADLAHRVFGSLFIETEMLPEHGALLARRRPRGHGESEVWLVQLLTSDGEHDDPLEFDTSRESFVGRGRDLRAPAALRPGEKLARNLGRVLDPALSMRRRVRLLPGKPVRRSLVTGLANSREEALSLIEGYSAPHGVSRTFELAWADARVELKHLGITAVEVHRFQRLLSAVVYPRPGLRERAGLPPARAEGRAALWSQGISGDLPLVVFRMDQSDFGDLCRELLLAHEFWRLNGVSVDLVLVNEEPSGYAQPLWEAALGLIRANHAEGQLDQRGGVHLRRGDTMNDDQRAHLFAAARVVLLASRGSLSRQLRLSAEPRALPDSMRPLRAAPRLRPPARVERPELQFDNGTGGFDESGREYVIVLEPGSVTPAPWSNVLANPDFGCVVTESGSSFTWFGNSQRHRLTPWNNDPISDPSGELLYLRDEDDGAIWSPTPRPLGTSEHFVVRHGQGYSSFEHRRSEIKHTLSVFVSPRESVKFYRLQLQNLGTTPRRLSLFALVEWVLGSNRELNRMSVVTSWDHDAEALFATNPLATFHDRHAFLTATRKVQSFTADREEFFGLSGSRQRPRALERASLSGRQGGGLDPCAALQVPLQLGPGEAIEVSFVLGEAENRAEARALSLKYGNDAAVVRTFDEAVDHWDQLLGTVRVKTPDRALDLMMNRWLLYQVTACRLWGRSAFYQSSGAFGFRDQLQDVLALLHTRPDLARAHLLRSAARQFTEGDVQHWWHPEGGEGVRTHCSDDLLWLPFAVSEYVRVTGDRGVLDEVVPFLTERALAPTEDDLFNSPRSGPGASLYEHCTRALDRGRSEGPHGLPKIGSCDWNDGMNRVGALGQGESVWLAWFLAKTLLDFEVLAKGQRDLGRASWCEQEVKRLARVVDEHGWDGSWYRRAYFDDGTPLGTQQGDECKIDAIAQSWAVISGIGDPNRAALALAKSEELLIREEPRTMLLLWPAFERTPHDPGYIKAYPPGVRENGGQYTHGVLWTLQALARLGEGDRAGRLISLLNPVQHARTRADTLRYRVEPYVVAADVYSGAGHDGRGGWTWYTGAAGWMYRIVLESMLGLARRGDHLTMAPCVPRAWNGFEIEYRYQKSVYVIRVENPHGVMSGVRKLEVDGNVITDGRIALDGGGGRHEVRVLMGGDADQRSPSLFPEATASALDDHRRASG